MRRRSRSLAVREEGVKGFGSEGDGVKRSRGPGEWLFAPSVKVSITIRDSFLRKGEKETEKGEDYFSLWNFKINRIFSVGKIGGIESGWYEFTNNDDKFKELARGPIEKFVYLFFWLILVSDDWKESKGGSTAYFAWLAPKPSKGGWEESVHEHTTRYLHLIENLLLHESFYRNSITLREPIRVARRRKRIPIDGFLLPIFVFPSWICSRPETHSRNHPLFVRYKRNTDGFNYD